jgi:phosphoribosyl 1,2-cyclic phosphate phosphodiesterase
MMPTYGLTPDHERTKHPERSAWFVPGARRTIVPWLYRWFTYITGTLNIGVSFTFLGTGTSAGVPMIGCSCDLCVNGSPKDQRTRTSACLRFTDAKGRARTILLDAGPDLRVQALLAGLSRCDAILFTHNHVDHIFGLDEVRRFNAVQNAPVEIHADDATMQSIERVYKHIFDRENNINDSFVAVLLRFRISPEQITSNTPTRLHGVNFYPIPLLHGKLPVLGWRIEPDAELLDDTCRDIFPLCYCTDVSAIPTATWPRLRNTRTLALDCLRPRAHPTHLTLGQAVSIAHEVDADRTYFIHMSHDLAYEATNASLPERMELAWDGLTLGSPV